jgi:hypothetical protein
MALPSMVEGAVNAIVAHLQANFNANLDLVAEFWQPDPAKLNLVPVPPSSYYISDAVEALSIPAIFVVADRSPHDLHAQQWLRQLHQFFVGIVVEAVEAQRLQRMAWRYAQAGWLTLHDQNLTGGTRVQVTEINYGPTLGQTTPTGALRSFRKDITLRLDATQRENFR